MAEREARSRRCAGLPRRGGSSRRDRHHGVVRTRSAHDIESRFALGLLPSGIDPRHLASVLVGAIVALAISAAAALRARRRLAYGITNHRT